MKRLVTLSLVLAVVLSMGGLAFAASPKSPAQTYADIANVTVEEAYALRGTNKTFGQLADENNLLDDFRKANIASRKEILANMVEDNQISQEQADEIISFMEENNCPTLGEKRLGQKIGVGFGRQANGNGQGLRRGNGNGFRFSNN